MATTIVPETLTGPLTEGLPHPRGACWDGKGTNFAIFSAHATKVEVCLFDENGEKELERIIRAARVHQPDLARLSAGRRNPERFTDIGFTGPMNLRLDTVSTPTSCCSDPYARGPHWRAQMGPGSILATR